MDSTMKGAIITSGSALIVGLLTYLGMRHKKSNLNTKSTLIPLNKMQIHSELAELKRRIVQDFKVPTSVHDSQTKENVFRDIMFHKVTIWDEQISKLQYKFTCAGNCENCTTYIDSMFFHNDIIREGMQKYREYWKTNGKSYTKKEIQALEIAMEKFVVLHKKNEKRVLDTIEYGHKTDGTLTFCAQFTAYHIIRSFESALYSMLEDVELALEDLNGDLSHLTFAKREYTL